jgi:mycothiol synthase
MPESMPGPLSETLPPEVPAGWVTRGPRPDDARALYDLVVACDVAVLGKPDVAFGDVVADIGVGAELQTVVLDGERAVAWAWMRDRAAGRTLADVYVDPQLPEAVAEPLAAWCWGLLVTRASSVATRRGRESTTLEVGSLDADVRTEKRLRARGFDRVRTFWRMRRQLSDQDLDARSTPGPEGIHVRPVLADDLAAVHQMLEDAFDDHWGHRRHTYDEWWTHVSSTHGFDLSLWWLAELDGALAGALIGTAQMADEDAIYISTLGTKPSARGRGVGKALLRKAFAAGVERGWGWARLNVDSASSTSAPQLYRSVGMTVEFAMNAWQLEVRAD